jgi:hypothetical protein
MPSQPSCQDTNVSLKTGLKNIRRSTPTRDQKSPLETRVEETNQDANLAADFAVLTTTLNKLNPTNMPSSTKEYLVRTATLLQNRANDIRQQQLQQQAITEKIILENSRTKGGDVLESQELIAVWEQIETLQTMREALREQQFKSIIEVGVELQDILQEFKKLHNAYLLPEGDLDASVTPVANTPDCILDTPRKHDGPALQNTRIPQNPRKIRKEKKKHTSPPSPPQTLEPEKTDHIAPSPDPSCGPRSSPGETTTLPPPSAMEPTSRTRLTTKDKEHYLHLQHISPPHALWILYKAIEGDLAAAQYTRTEIREYIRDLQSHNEPSSPRTSNKCLPTPGESYLAPKGHFFKENSRIALTNLGPQQQRSTPHPRHIRKKKKPHDTSPQHPSAQASQHPMPATKHGQLCQTRPWDPYDTSDPSSYSDPDSDDPDVEVSNLITLDHLECGRPCTRRDTTDPDVDESNLIHLDNHKLVRRLDPPQRSGW